MLQLKNKILFEHENRLDKKNGRRNRNSLQSPMYKCLFKLAKKLLTFKG